MGRISRRFFLTTGDQAKYCQNILKQIIENEAKDNILQGGNTKKTKIKRLNRNKHTKKRQRGGGEDNIPDYIKLTKGDVYDYQYGWGHLKIMGTDTLMHTGSWNECLSLFCIVPDKNVGFVLSMNIRYYPGTQEIKKEFFQNIGLTTEEFLKTENEKLKSENTELKKKVEQLTNK